MTKNFEELKVKEQETLRLKWEYARRNPDLIAEYDNLVQLASKVCNAPVETEIDNWKILIESAQHYINRWQYHLHDPRLPMNSYSTDPPKRLLLELGAHMARGLIPGIKGETIRAVKLLTPLPGLAQQVGPKKNCTNEAQVARRMKAYLSGKGKIINVIGEMPDKILLEVNLISPRESIALEFKEIIDECFRILKFQGRIFTLKPRSVELKRDLRIYDFIKQGNSTKKAAQKFFKNDVPENAARKIGKALKRAQAFVSEGYKKLA